tara:strand:- start:792 stop:992 length:201 start_codon:yes stop_codon:yes gene_type:complete
MNYRKDNIESIGKILELEGEIKELKKVLVICANERDFYKTKFSQCNEWGGSEEYINFSVGIDNKIN